MQHIHSWGAKSNFVCILSLTITPKWQQQLDTFIYSAWWSVNSNKRYASSGELYRWILATQIHSCYVNAMYVCCPPAAQKIVAQHNDRSNCHMCPMVTLYAFLSLIYPCSFQVRFILIKWAPRANYQENHFWSNDELNLIERKWISSQIIQVLTIWIDYCNTLTMFVIIMKMLAIHTLQGNMRNWLTLSKSSIWLESICLKVLHAFHPY